MSGWVDEWLCVNKGVEEPADSSWRRHACASANAYARVRTCVCWMCVRASACTCARVRAHVCGHASAQGLLCTLTSQDEQTAYVCGCVLSEGKRQCLAVAHWHARTHRSNPCCALCTAANWPVVSAIGKANHTENDDREALGCEQVRSAQTAQSGPNNGHVENIGGTLGRCCHGERAKGSARSSAVARHWQRTLNGLRNLNATAPDSLCGL